MKANRSLHKPFRCHQGREGEVQVPSGSVRAAGPSGECDEGEDHNLEDLREARDHHQRASHQDRGAEPHHRGHHLPQAAPVSGECRAH